MGLRLTTLLFVGSAMGLHLAHPSQDLAPGHLFARSAKHSLDKRLLNSFDPVPTAYKAPPQRPLLFNATWDSLFADAYTLMNKTNEISDAVVADVPVANATFANAMMPMVWDDARWATDSNVIYFYQYVSPNETLRDASVEAGTLLDNYSIDVSLREDVFALVDHIFQTLNTTGADLDAESRRLVERTRKGYIVNGLGIPAGAKRERYKVVKTRLSDLATQFSRNLNEESGGVWLTPEELRGVPPEVIPQFAKGEGENAGKVRVTFKYPDINPTMRFSLNSTTRRKMYVANENRVKENAAILKEAVVLRAESALLLGYQSHAHRVIEDRMARTPATVNAFLADLRSRLEPQGAIELKRFLDFKAADLTARNATDEIDGSFYLWDLGFYSRLMIEQDYEIDQFALSEYFPVQHTVAAMLQIFEELLGFVFVELSPEEKAKLSPTGKGEDLTWHEEVIFFSVWDSAALGGGFVGYLYMDLHPRQGKYGHAANFNLQAGYLKEDGTSRQYPSTALVCNLNKGTAERPALLRHDEVTTLFHELGHGIHDLSGRTRYSTFHGTRTVRDFVEAPSQMLENWCWTPSTLKRLTSHYKTGESIPDELIEKLIATKHVNEATGNLRQIHYGQFDMAIHSAESLEAAEKLDPIAIYNDMRLEIAKMKGEEAFGADSHWGNGAAAFSHMMGYDAAYYGYLWSQVYSLDMFYSAFRANPMNATVGLRYRRTVLEKGGSRDEMDSLTEFLGRAPSNEAFYEELGVSGKK